MKKLILTPIFIIVCSICSVFSQNSIQADTTKVRKAYEIELNDGSSFTGTILSKDSTKIVFRTNSISRIDIPTRQVKSLKEVLPESPGKQTYKLANPFPTKYFFTQSAINLHKEEGYYQNTYVFLNSLNFGLTDYFSIGGGIELLSTIGSLTTRDISPSWYIGPKLGFKVSDKFYLGGGVTFANIGGFFDNTTIGLGYGLATFGSTEHNFTVGLGNIFSFDTHENNMTITLSGMTRVSERIALVTENYIIPANNGVNSAFAYGMRFIASKISVDLGFINNKDIIKELFIGIPYVDFNIRFCLISIAPQTGQKYLFPLLRLFIATLAAI